ncbi:hypothetical protein DFH11DRAFT_1721957 [Phellopilus nigrolimitatus]|nr:hypothetical protein DFH11DRAFT_1721957 [Phellopilus nigrolimitatus]
MAKVQAHRRTRSSFKLRSASNSSFLNSLVSHHLLVALALLCAPSTVIGQAFPSNGQFFTKALAISDAPAPGRCVGDMCTKDIAAMIDPYNSEVLNTQGATWLSPSTYVPLLLGDTSELRNTQLSGDGNISQSAFIPGSGSPTRYDSLEIFFVSSQTDSNFTVSNGTGFLSQESGSTVKHLNWPIPSCVLPGVYNLTYYESSHINNKAFFSITPLIVTVDNPKKGGNSSQCDSISNPLQDQPQADSAPPINPYLDPNSGIKSSGISNGGMPTITVGPSGLPTQWTMEPSGSSVTDATVPITTATMVVISTDTLTETVTTGQSSVFTTTAVVTTTVTAVMATSDITAGGFLPVNGALIQPAPYIFAFLSTCAILPVFLF